MGETRKRDRSKTGNRLVNDASDLTQTFKGTDVNGRILGEHLGPHKLGGGEFCPLSTFSHLMPVRNIVIATII